MTNFAMHLAWWRVTVLLGSTAPTFRVLAMDREHAVAYVMAENPKAIITTVELAPDTIPDAAFTNHLPMDRRVLVH